jgi:hypothetical protein
MSFSGTSNRNEYQEFSWGKVRLARKSDSVNTICGADCLENIGTSTSDNPTVSIASFTFLSKLRLDVFTPLQFTNFLSPV